MSNPRRIAQWFLLGALALGTFAGCLSSDPDPTATPIAAVPTDTDPPAEPEPTATDEPAATLTETSEPEEVAESSPTPSPSQEGTLPPLQGPRPTRTPIAIQTPTPEPGTISTGGLELPSDLLSIMPQPEDGPPGLFVFDEGPESAENVASDAADIDARAEQLREWGFQDAVFRELHMADEEVDEANPQLLLVIALAVLMDAPETARLEMQTHLTEITLPNPELNMSDVPIDPLGDQWGAAATTIANDDGEFQLGIVWTTAGPLSLRFIGASGAEHDPIPDLVQVARAMLDRLGYSGLPQPGELLLQTDFSNWFSGELDSGALYFGDDEAYHVLVEHGEGSWVSAYSTDHEPLSDIAVSVDILMVSGDETAQGCVTTRIDPSDQLYDYAFCIDGAGNLEAIYEQFDAETGYSAEPLLPYGTVRGPQPTEWLTLTIVARGEEFWFLVNGELAGRARHAGPPGGAVGVLVNNFGETPAEFLFANLTVWALE